MHTLRKMQRAHTQDVKPEHVSGKLCPCAILAARGRCAQPNRHTKGMDATPLDDAEPNGAEEEGEEDPARNKFKWPSDQCKEVDAITGVRCDKYRTGRGGKCVAHGGWSTCKEKGCTTRPTLGHYCDAHKPPYNPYPEGVTRGECRVPWCSNIKILPSGYCNTRHKNEEEHEIQREWTERLARDRHLRDKWLDVLLEAQGGKCAQNFITCEVVDDGQATSVCPWGDRPVPRGAAQVDHITPLGEGGTNEKANLQALCACCHALKSLAEARAKAAARRRRLA